MGLVMLLINQLVGTMSVHTVARPTRGGTNVINFDIWSGESILTHEKLCVMFITWYNITGKFLSSREGIFLGA